MNLTEEQFQKTVGFNSILKNKTEKYLEERDVIPCNKCNRTGLSYTRMSDGDVCWDGSTYCDECNGIGYKNINKGFKVGDDYEKYLCRKCDGIGCSECDKGIVDNIAHMMGR